MVREIRADLARYRGDDGKWKDILFNPALWALLWYRFGHWIYKENSNSRVLIPLKIVYLIGYKFCEVFMEMCLDPSAEIGEGLYIAHVGGIHINPDAIVGRNCDIAHRVTIGTSAMGRKGAPRLGNDVYVGTGAAIIGNIKVGDRAKIAANTLVITNIPTGATVMGVPGRIVMKEANVTPDETLQAAAEV
jgi:serine O-acetyltransferase